ncbi:MAG TPA: right-handed parallel beta-helix repeat-containing protein [Candidatus Deferrimicrobium sp.]|nr:right-handed parallel beta-helix repeat-containing protein [Candidatus Deferrimicrobium sp.]
MTRSLISAIAVYLIALGTVTVAPQAATIHVPADQPTIQAGLDAAASGDTVVVANGTYSGPGNHDIDFGGKAVVLLSESGPDSTIIDCGGTPSQPRRAFYFHNGENLMTVVQGFTIRGGYQFFDETTETFGGAILADTSSPTVANCVFEGNFSLMGGAVACHSGSVAFVDCTFRANRAWYGGGVYARMSAPSFLRCTFDADSGGHSGGGIYAVYGTGIAVTECEFVNNVCHTGGSGGGMHLVACSSSTITNCLFADNFAHGAGALVCYYYTSPTITNCTFVGNSSNGAAAAIHCGDYSAPHFQNCLIAFNTNGVGIFCYQSSPTLSCSNVYGNSQGDWVDCLAGQLYQHGNLSEDPFLCDTAAGDYHISTLSPCAPANNGCGVLIGAFGTNCGPTNRTWYVKPDGTGDAPTIQAAIDSCTTNDTVLAAAGTYTGAGNRDIELRGKRIRIVSEAGAAQTIIDCQGSTNDPHRGFYVHEGENFHTVIDGFTVTNGNVDTANGGALLISGASPEFHNCFFEANQAYSGGAVACFNADSLPRFNGCTFEGNTALNDGGAIFTGTGIRLIGCNLVGNEAIANGGAIHFFTDDSALYATDTSYVHLCVVARNTAGSTGGAFYIAKASPTITSTTVFDNHCTYGGAVTIASYSHVLLIESILAFNRGGSAVACYGTYPYTYLNCTDVFGNEGGDWTDCIASQHGLMGNFSADPQFCDTTTGDLHLNHGSPCLAPNNPCLHLIGALGAGCRSFHATIQPNLIEPTSLLRGQSMVVTIRVGDFQGGYTAVDIDPATLVVNSHLMPSSWTILTSHPDFESDVMEMTVDLTAFAGDYAELCDLTIQSYAVAGVYSSDGSPFATEGSVMVRGHLTGDVDNTDNVNVADLTYFVGYLFQGGQPPVYLGTGDFDKDGAINIADLVLLVDWLFGGE